MIRVGLILIAVFIVSIFTARAQNSVKIDTSQSIEELIRDKFLQGGVEISNITYYGSANAIGFFTCKSDSFPLSEGILLTTGRASQVVGPNNNFGFSGANNTPGDTTLDRICKGQTYDAAVIEFDFIPSSENVAFDFIFASEEYPEFVNTEFNDVFAFIVTDLSSKKSFNIAYLPKTLKPITVNNVNHLTNSIYYIDNPAAGDYYFVNGNLKMATPDVYESTKKGKKKEEEYRASVITTKCKTGLCKIIQYDGFTRSLTAKSKVVPDQLYHFKIAIADVHDKVYDSGVILRAQSFKSYDKYGIIKGDTTGFIVKDEDIINLITQKPKVVIPPKEEILYKGSPVFFDFDSAALTDSASQELNRVSQVLIGNPKLSVQLYAHTDSLGSNEYNNALSLKRGEAVKRQLENLGVPARQIKMNHFGEFKPYADNNTESGRKLNRRVEVQIY